MSNLLAIETTLGACSVAHSAGPVERLQARNRQTSELAGMVERVMAQAGQDYADLDGYAVTIGPGSFSSVRIGIAFMRGLALAVPKPIYAVSTLSLLAFQAMEAVQPAISAQGRGDIFGLDEEITVAINAFRGQVYRQRFAVNGNLPEPLDEPQEMPLELLAEEHRPVMGDGAELVGKTSITAPIPCAEALVRYVQRLPVPDISEKPAPLYIRPPDAKKQSGDLTTG